MNKRILTGAVSGIGYVALSIPSSLLLTFVNPAALQGSVLYWFVWLLSAAYTLAGILFWLGLVAVGKKYGLSVLVLASYAKILIFVLLFAFDILLVASGYAQWVSIAHNAIPFGAIEGVLAVIVAAVLMKVRSELGAIVVAVLIVSIVCALVGFLPGVDQTLGGLADICLAVLLTLVLFRAAKA
jgi:hypothetical protein